MSALPRLTSKKLYAYTTYAIYMSRVREQQMQKLGGRVGHRLIVLIVYGRGNELGKPISYCVGPETQSIS